MLRESMLGYLLRKEAAVRAMADAASKCGESIEVGSAIKTVRRQISQIAPINGGNPLTGEGITK
jgi:hypothetical protein